MLQYIGWCSSLSVRVWQNESGDIVESKTKKRLKDKDLRLWIDADGCMVNQGNGLYKEMSVKMLKDALDGTW
jgi:hypothetical protein